MSEKLTKSEPKTASGTDYSKPNPLIVISDPSIKNYLLSFFKRRKDPNYDPYTFTVEEYYAKKKRKI